MTNNKMMRAPWYWLILFLAAGCSLNDTPALRVGGNLWPGYEPMFLADERGYFDKDSVKIITFSSAVDVMRAYRNGSLDMAALTADEAIAVASREPGKHSIFLIADISVGGDAIIAQPEFSSLESLRGKRVGAELNALGALMLARALERHGMIFSDIVLMPLALERHELAFKNREVDAVVTFEPRRHRLLASGGREVFSSAEIRGEIVDVVIARRDQLKTDLARMRGFVSAWFRASREIVQHGESLSARQAARYGVTQQEFQTIIKTLEFVSLEDNRSLLGGQLIEPLNKLSKVMLSHGVVQNSPDVSSLLDAAIVSEL